MFESISFHPDFYLYFARLVLKLSGCLMQLITTTDVRPLYINLEIYIPKDGFLTKKRMVKRLKCNIFIALSNKVVGLNQEQNQGKF